MRFLIFGFLTLSAWSVFATYIYVCKIKELCDDPITMQIVVDNHHHTTNNDTLGKTKIQEQIRFSNNRTVYFAFDKSEFNSNAETDKYVEESKAYLNANPLAHINIIGHTDNIGTIEYNQALGYKRAQTMLHYFADKGLLTSKIRIQSKGENEPTDDNNTAAGRTYNRRTEITIKK